MNRRATSARGMSVCASVSGAPKSAYGRARQEGLATGFEHYLTSYLTSAVTSGDHNMTLAVDADFAITRAATMYAVPCSCFSLFIVQVGNQTSQRCLSLAVFARCSPRRQGTKYSFHDRQTTSKKAYSVDFHKALALSTT